MDSRASGLALLTMIAQAKSVPRLSKPPVAMEISVGTYPKALKNGIWSVILASSPIGATSETPAIIIPSAPSLLVMKLLETLASGWNLRNPSASRSTTPFNSLPAIRRPPTTLNSFSYGGMVLRSGAWAKAAEAQRAASNGAVFRRKRMVSFASVELPELFERRRGGQRQVSPISRDDVLSLAADDEAQELAQPRLERRARRAIEEDVDAPHQRIGPVLERPARGEYVGPAFARRERDGFDAGDSPRLRHHRPGDAVAIVGQFVPQHVHEAQALPGTVFVRDHLAAGLDELAVVRVPLVAVVQHHRLEESGRA